ncbi:MAG: Uma2 family endonuclease [Planctomycetaceae bacterium]|nr:Uma2 family endonuclease [Planctomycetaceae bacterium]
MNTPRPTCRHPSVSASSRLQFSPRAPLTDRLFLRLCGANPDLCLERTALGELLIMPPSGSGSGGRNLRIAQQLANWVDASGLGVGFDSSAGFALPDGAIRSPDACWVARDRWDALTPDEQEGFAPLCPDCVIELRSPADPLKSLREKMREYRAQGARLGWLIDPRRKVVEVYRPRCRVEVLRSPASLSCEDVLPGFVLDLKGILG